jgi:cyclophilin family peptidyl-prolyl cis-trans isomerase
LTKKAKRNIIIINIIIKKYMSKKISILFLLLFLTLAITGCGQKDTNIMDQETNQNNEPQEVASSSRLSTEEVATSTQALPGQEDLYSQYKKVMIKTNYGDIEVELFGGDSPLTVNNFLNLAKKGFYNGTKFHRVIPDFMIQGGDPNSKDDDWSNDGTGGPGYQFIDEFNDHLLVRGSLAMANSGEDTNGSQFFIVTKESTPWLDGKHTNFGRVISGMKTVTKIEDLNTNENDHPTKDAIINSIELK